MAVPAFSRSLLGAGAGAVAGAGTGALSGPKDQTRSQRVGRAILGGMGGAALGGAAHTGVRYHQLRKAGYSGGLGTLEGAALGGSKVDDISDYIRASKAVKDAPPPPPPKQEFNFSGSAADMKKQFREYSRKYHPDTAAPGVDPNMFARMRDEYEAAIKNLNSGSNSAALVKMASFFDELVKLSSNRITAGLRIPGIANGAARGLASPKSAGGKNLAKFQLSGPNKSTVTGTSTTAHNPASQLSAGATGFAGIPAPPSVL